MPRKKKNFLLQITKGIFKGSWWVVKGISKWMYNISKFTVNKTSKSVSKIGKNAPSTFDSLNLEKTLKGSFDEFIKKVNEESLIITIVGKRGSGKSSLGFRLLENAYSKTK